MSHPLSQRLDALSYRAWLVAAVECAGLGAGALAMAGAAVGGWLAIGLGATGATIGLIVSRWLVPSRIEIARRIDRRFALQERTVTAVEAEHAGDAMAALLRDDAWQRVRGRTLAEVFAPRPARLIAAAAMVVVAAGWSFRSPAALPSSSTRPATATAGSDGSATSPPAASAEGEAAADATPSSDGPAQNESALPAPSPAATAPAATNRADMPPPSASIADVGAVGQAPATEGMTASAQAGTQGKPGRALSGISALALDQDAGSQTPAEGEAPATAAAAARARAALARRDLPPGLRTYVRDYFLRVTQ